MNEREKYWEELTADEKIERMREIVKQMSRAHDYQQAKIDKLEKHSHENGMIMIPYQTGPTCERSSRNEKYF